VAVVDGTGPGSRGKVAGLETTSIRVVEAALITFTFVMKRAGWSDEDFFRRWTEHTRDFDLVDHPYITKNRLMLVKGDTPYIGIAENHWPDAESLVATEAFYRETERGRAHWADLEQFMDIEASPTVVVSREADVGDQGIVQLFPPLETNQ
jgi:hypothetical protein